MCVESLVTAVVDMYPKTFRVGYRRELLILGMSVASFILGLTMLTEVRKIEKQCICMFYKICCKCCLEHWWMSTPYEKVQEMMSRYLHKLSYNQKLKSVLHICDA